MNKLDALRDADFDRDSLMLFGGLALVVLGAGLILTNRAVRGHLGGLNVGKLVSNAAPDLQRYLNLKAM